MSVGTGELVFERLSEIDIGPQGKSFTLIIEGARPFVEEQLTFYAIGAARCNYRNNGATGQIVVTYAGEQVSQQEVPKDVISLKTSEVQQALYLNPRYTGLHPAVIKEVRQTVQDGTDYSDATGKITAATLVDGRGGQALALELYDFIVGGNDSYQLCVRTISRTRTVSQRFNRKVAQDDVESLFTPQQLADYLGSAIPFTVPTLTLTNEETAKGLVVSWRKFQCDCDDTAGGQAQLVESWQLAKWVGLHYRSKAA